MRTFTRKWVLAMSAVCVAWVLGVIAAGAVGDVGSYMGWLVVAVVAFGPSTMFLYWLRPVPLTMTQRIAHARR